MDSCSNALRGAGSVFEGTKKHCEMQSSLLLCQARVIAVWREFGSRQTARRLNELLLMGQWGESSQLLKRNAVAHKSSRDRSFGTDVL
jgi:hypothetical protein